MPDDPLAGPGETPDAAVPAGTDTPAAPQDGWEEAARSLLGSRIARLPQPMQELAKSLPGGTAPGALVKFVEQAEAAAAALASGPPVPKSTDARRTGHGDAGRADEQLWNELMQDGRRALELRRRRPDLYDALRQRFGGRPRTRKD
ncbi:MAG: hypothetical protein KIT79_06975 [Deltaproteobacteria bacterium]|nr:hypothetical protein [Deltaproteobacteria bacterium]